MGHDARAIARYMLSLAAERGMRLTPMHILKLVYIAQGWCLALYNKSLIRDSVAAWPYGPVIPKLYHAVKKYGAGDIWGEIEGPDEPLDPDEKELAELVLDRYGYLQAFQLSALTHQKNSPWDIVRRKQGGVSGYLIPNDLIKKHYVGLATKAQQRHAG